MGTWVPGYHGTWVQWWENGYICGYMGTLARGCLKVSIQSDDDGRWIMIMISGVYFLG